MLLSRYNKLTFRLVAIECSHGSQLKGLWDACNVFFCAANKLKWDFTNTRWYDKHILTGDVFTLCVWTDFETIDNYDDKYSDGHLLPDDDDDDHAHDDNHDNEYSDLLPDCPESN